MTGADAPSMRVRVVLAWRDAAHVVELDLAPRATIGAAIRAAMPELRRQCAGGSSRPLSWTAVGVHGRLVVLEDEAHDGDRIELYRPLLADPKEARRLRARGRPG